MEDPELWNEIRKGSSLKSTQLLATKKPRTAAQIEAFEKCAAKRRANVEVKKASSASESTSNAKSTSSVTATEEPLKETDDLTEDIPVEKKVKKTLKKVPIQESDSSGDEVVDARNKKGSKTKSKVIVVNIPTGKDSKGSKRRKSRGRERESSSSEDSSDESSTSDSSSDSDRPRRRKGSVKKKIRREISKYHAYQSMKNEPAVGPPPEVNEAPKRVFRFV